MKYELDTLKKQLEDKTTAYNAIVDASKAQQERIQKLEANLTEVEGYNESLAKQLAEARLQRHGSHRELPDHFKLQLVTACIGLMRDRMTGDVMSDKEFEAYSDAFVNQAFALADKVYTRCLDRTETSYEALPDKG